MICSRTRSSPISRAPRSGPPAPNGLLPRPQGLNAACRPRLPHIASISCCRTRPVREPRCPARDRGEASSSPMKTSEKPSQTIPTYARSASPRRLIPMSPWAAKLAFVSGSLSDRHRGPFCLDVGASDRLFHECCSPTRRDRVRGRCRPTASASRGCTASETSCR